MKVITEEDVNFICNVIDGVDNSLDVIDKNNIVHLLQSHLQKIDTLTVSKLRPMRDAPDDINILIDHDFSSMITESRAITRKLIIITSAGFEVDYADCSGWLPMPIYKPGLTEE